MEQGSERRPVAVAGIVIMGSGVVALLAALWAARRAVRGTELFGWSTIPALWPLLSAVLVAALIVMISPRHAREAAVVTLVCALQLVGGGIAASRDWFDVRGGGNLSPYLLVVLIPLTVVLVAAMTVACCVAVVLLWHPGMTWRPQSPGWVAAGVLIAAVPPVLILLEGSEEVTVAGQIALVWSLPWAAGIAAAGWLDKPLRRIAAATVLAGAVLTPAILITWALSWAALHLVDAVGRDALMIGAVAVLSAWAGVAYLMWRRERRRARLVA
ncbi:hypothetical protein [Actinoplanes sp. CA-252034]|uniref:hypothetical protein n=1 Tax=Actinoplanes sp. CA-252034 TaxID=3239906 RepID=UPI003D96AE86